jgi:ketosteroid isomerase-like protein
MCSPTPVAMHPNEALIHQFYTCFQQKDYQGMQECYADNATFSDPAFQNLNAEQVRKMWEMLISRGKDLVLTFENVQASDTQGSADWTAHYTFSATGKKVVNRIHASFVFEKGKIVQHRDHFNFYKWMRQALGFPGLMFGWTSFLRESVRQKAIHNLSSYMQKTGS